MFLFIDKPMPATFIDSLDYIGEARVAVGGHPGSLYKATILPESSDLTFIPIDLFHKGKVVYAFTIQKIKQEIQYE